MNDLKTTHLTLRLTPKQKELLQAAAAKQGVNLDEFITASALVRTQAVIAPDLTQPGDSELPAELTLHQAAELLNVSTTYIKDFLQRKRITHHGEGARLRNDRDTLLSY